MTTYNLLDALPRLHALSETAFLLDKEINDLVDGMGEIYHDYEFIEKVIDENENQISKLIKRMIVILNGLDEKESQKKELLSIIKEYHNARKLLINLREFKKEIGM